MSQTVWPNIGRPATSPGTAWPRRGRWTEVAPGPPPTGDMPAPVHYSVPPEEVPTWWPAVQPGPRLRLELAMPRNLTLAGAGVGSGALQLLRYLAPNPASGVGSGALALFVPAPDPPLTGLVLRVKAQGQAFANNDPVDTAVSSVGPNLTQATSGKRPTFKTGVQNGKSAFRLDGADDRLVSAANVDLSGTDDITYVLIGGPISSQGEVALLHHNTGTVAQSGFAFWPNISGGVIEMLNNGNGGQNWQNITGASAGVKAYAVSIDRAAAAASEITARVNGSAASQSTQASGNNSDNFASALLYVGSRPGDDLFCNADVLEILIYDHKLDSTELAALDAYTLSEYAL